MGARILSRIRMARLGVEGLWLGLATTQVLAPVSSAGYLARKAYIVRRTEPLTSHFVCLTLHDCATYSWEGTLWI